MRVEMAKIGDAGVELDAFVAKMAKHWEEELGNVVSEPLKGTWRQIASAFNEHIINDGDATHRSRWSILSPATGTGKTEAAVIYCSMLAEIEDENHPGVLIVSRLIDDCDKIAARINHFGRHDTAVAYHSDSDIKKNDLAQYPCLVITHAAYEIAVNTLKRKGAQGSTWAYLHPWMDEQRKLIIIDEQFEFVKRYAIQLALMRHTLAAIPYALEKEYTGAVGMIRDTIGRMEVLTEKKNDGQMQVIDYQRDEKPAFDMRPLMSSMERQRFDKQLKRTDHNLHKELLQRYLNMLEGVDCLHRGWGYYGNDDSIHTAELLIPEGLKGAVVLDATAKVSGLHELYVDSDLVEPIGATRDYKNFTLYVSRGHKVGKMYLKDNAKKEAPCLIKELNGRLKGKSVFVVSHQAVEPVVKKCKPSFTMHTGHWGAITGSNDWKDCDAVVIWGLPYLPPEWADSTLTAFNGANDLLGENGEYADIKKAIYHGNIAASVIQAINRISVRKVVDGNGNCPLSEGYLLLPDNVLADEIVGAIEQLMPGVQIKEWEYAAEAETKEATGAKYLRLLVEFIQSMDKGRCALAEVRDKIGMSQSTLTRLVKLMKDGGSILYELMNKCGVTYETDREGKANRAYLVKQ